MGDKVKLSAGIEGVDGTVSFLVSANGVRVVLHTESHDGTLHTTSVLLPFPAVREIRTYIQRLRGEMPTYYTAVEDKND